MAASGQWGDLAPRVISAIVMSVIGVAAIWVGGPWFEGLATVLAGIMVWELVRMIDPEERLKPILYGLLTSFTLLAILMPFGLPKWALFLAVPVAGLIELKRGKFIFAFYSLAVILAVWELIFIRNIFGVVVMAGLVLIVVATDIAGYFAGKSIGGRKFWPSISPKKTWSGTIAGWIAAGLVGAVFVIWGGFDWFIIPAAMLLSFAGQLGDIAESAIKRRFGIKDSSNLIPGHGGFLDRFDALIGAALMAMLISFSVIFTATYLMGVSP